MTKNIYKIIIFCIAIFFSTGCEKFLSEKSDKSLALPTSVEHFQALLDGNSLSNFNNSGEVSSDDYTISDADFNNIEYEADKRLFTWQPDFVSTGSSGNDWKYCYQGIYYSNLVLNEIDKNSLAGIENVKGQALFYRACRYLDAAQIWAPVYNHATAGTDMGLPLRLDPDMNIPSKRSSVKQTYDQIIKDFTDASQLLDVRQISVERPPRWAAYAMLARTYLFMGEYQLALDNVGKTLLLHDTLMNFNLLNQADAYPIKRINNEIGLLSRMRSSPNILGRDIPNINSALYNLYDNDDLRKTIFFKNNSGGKIMFRGNYYDQRGIYMVGPTMDEIYLIAAECNARLENVNQAMSILNKLLVTRWKTGTYVDLVAANKDQALSIIQKERRKELLFRGLRWPDLKRYNRDGANITLSRTVVGVVYTLPPNDPRYAIAIPEDIIKLTGIPQNNR